MKKGGKVIHLHCNGWVGGSKSCFKDYFHQSKKYIIPRNLRSIVGRTLPEFLAERFSLLSGETAPTAATCGTIPYVLKTKK